MRHAAHKAGSARSARRMDSSSFSDYLAGARGRRGAAAVEAAGSGSTMAFTPVVDAALADKLNEVAPQTRRAMRQAAKACARKNHIMAGSALAVLFGSAWPLWDSAALTAEGWPWPTPGSPPSR